MGVRSWGRAIVAWWTAEGEDSAFNGATELSAIYSLGLDWCYSLIYDPHTWLSSAHSLKGNISTGLVEIAGSTLLLRKLLFFFTFLIYIMSRQVESGPYASTPTVLWSFTGYKTVHSLTTRVVLATQSFVVTSILAATTSIVLQPTTIYSTKFVPTTFTLTSTAFSTLERGLITSLVTAQTATSTVTASLLNLLFRVGFWSKRNKEI